MTEAAALLFALVTAVVVLFQIALALGAPWGAYAMGGKYPGRYPRTMRVSAAAQAGLLMALVVIVLSTAGLLLPSLSQALPSLIWLVVAFSGVGVVLNAITSSSGERRIWLPVAVVMLLSSLTVAITA